MIAFAAPQTEFIRGAHIGSLLLRDVTAEGVQGPCLRSWGDVAVPDADGLAGIAPDIATATEPFRTQAI